MADRASQPLTRRRFLARGTALAVAAPLAQLGAQDPAPPNPVTPPVLGEAEKLAAIELTPAERDQAARSVGGTVERYRRRRTLVLGPTDAPATRFDPGAFVSVRKGEESRRTEDDAGPLPHGDEDIAFAPVTRLSRWIERRELTSERLTRIYLERLERLGPGLECVITVTRDRALAEARQADTEIASGQYRGPLHGIPYGAKDLFDTADIPTTWGAEPYRDRVPDTDAAVIRLLGEAGAVLVAKTTLGALAMGDVWYGGRTRSPWNRERGSSGSSAGSASATAAGLVGFSLGTETLGSIVSPSMRCGVTGLRPTFGRVPRTGAMTLCWSLDKAGPICRTVEDAALVLAAISAPDAGDPSSVAAPFEFDATWPVKGLRVGYSPRWFAGRGATDVDRAALGAARRLGLELVEFELPDWPYGSLRTILEVEASAAFEELTLSGRDDELVSQGPNSWPNKFRSARFVPAVELVQADRLRRRVCVMMQEKLSGLDAVFGPSYAGGLLLITNFTGHPSLTLRAGFLDRRGVAQPHGVTLWGNLFDEMTICRIGMALERELGVWDRRPPE